MVPLIPTYPLHIKMRFWVINYDEEMVPTMQQLRNTLRYQFLSVYKSQIVNL